MSRSRCFPRRSLIAETMSPTATTFAALTPKLIAAIALVAMMVQLGLALEPVRDKAVKRHERWLVVRALAFNFALVPAMALLTKRALGASGPGAIALLLLAATPGGRCSGAKSPPAR